MACWWAGCADRPVVYLGDDTREAGASTDASWSQTADASDGQVEAAKKAGKEVAVKCVADTSCVDPGYPRCNTALQQCVECLSDSDCIDPSQRACNTANNHCVECTRNEHCGASGSCDLEDHECD